MTADDRTTRRTGAGFLSRLLLIVGSLAVTVLLMEIGLRVAGISYPRFLEMHDVLGSVHRPGISFRQRDEGDAFIRISRSGDHDVERTVAKPAGAVRIIVLGDSFVEAMQVNQPQTMTAVMEKALNGCGSFSGRKVEVLNFGVTGYGTAQEYLLLKERVWAYAPDLVVIGFLTGNDFRNNCLALRRDPGRPYFVYENDSLVLDTSFRKTFQSSHPGLKKLVQGAIDNSRVAQLFYRAKTVAQRRKSAKLRQAEANNAPIQDVGLDDQIYTEPKEPAWEEAWRITEDLLRMIRDEAAAHAVPLLVVTLSNAAQVDPDPAVRQATLTRLGAADLFYPDERLRSFGDREGITVVNLAPPMQLWAEAHQAYLHGFVNTRIGTGHWNIEGHRVGGILTAREIDRLYGGGACRDLEPQGGVRLPP